MDVDFIIVGQGIAGSCLAVELLRRGKSVVIFDAEWRDAACLVAAGVINPITGQRLVKSWRSSVAHPYAKNFYVELERELCAKFYHPRNILQLCKSPEERELWEMRIQDQAYASYVERFSPPNSFPDLNDSFGSYVIGHSAWVETRSALSAFKKYFLERGVLRLEDFDYSALSPIGERVQYRGFSASKIVFAEGWQVVKNPYFSWLPYRPAKGEILTLRADTNLPDHVVHRGNWIMKCGENLFRLGSTWDREHLDSIPTDSAKAELESALPALLPNLNGMFIIEHHEAGVRPCTATTRPHIGFFPSDKRIFSFNGFGSKGFALSPYLAKMAADALIDGSPIDPECNIARHTRKFFKGA